MRAVVTGSRGEKDRGFVFRELDRIDRIDRDRRIDVVIEGGQRLYEWNRDTRQQEIVGGVDYHAKCWAAARSRECITVKAEWTKHGRSAGPIRNRLMLEHERPDVVIGFPGHAGTADCLRRARHRGIEVIVVERTEA